MKLLTVLALVYVGLFVSAAESSNVLGIFNFPSKSHHILGHALLKGLARRGHNVTMVSPFSVDEAMPNYTHIEVGEVNRFKEEHLQDFFQGNMSVFRMLWSVSLYQRMNTILLESQQLQDLLSSDSKFDVVIMMVGLGDVLLGVADHYKVPVVGFATIGGITTINTLLGNPNPYAYVPNAMSSFSDVMSFKERVLNTLFGFGMTVMQLLMRDRQNELLKKYFPNSPPLGELEENIGVILVNSHVSTESPRPYLPNMIQIGGFNLNEAEPLPGDLQRFLDESTEGVVYLSFGTNVKPSALPPEVLAAFVQAFAKTPQKILWKYDGDELPGKPGNVKLSKWLPQTGVLAHPNVKVFISHGGMGSTTEALYHGVPLVCVPFFGDQAKNCADSVRYGFGKLIKVGDLSEDLLLRIINEILEDAQYVANIKFRSELFREQPMRPMDKAIYWVEHVIKHGGAKHLRAQVLKLSWYQALLLDVVAFLGVVALLVSCAWYYAAKLIFRRIFSRKEPRKQKAN